MISDFLRIMGQAAFFVIVVGSIPFLLLVEKLQRARRIRFRQQMTEKGRFLVWSEVCQRLNRNEGTLIFQRYFPKGPHRVWWVNDDLLSNCPFQIPNNWSPGIPEDDRVKNRNYALQCSQKLDPALGVAMFTNFPWSSFEPPAQKDIIEVCLWAMLGLFGLHEPKPPRGEMPTGRILTLTYGIDEKEPFLCIGMPPDPFGGSKGAS